MNLNTNQSLSPSFPFYSLVITRDKVITCVSGEMPCDECCFRRCCNFIRKDISGKLEEVE